MMSTSRSLAALGACALAGVLSLAACAADGNDPDAVPLSPTAAEGRSISLSNGCAACHGTNGEGGVGPPFVGLAGSTVELDDGTSVVADRAYLIESIKDPGAKQQAGYRLPMPSNRLTDDQIDKIIAWIDELSPQSSVSTEPTGSTGSNETTTEATTP
jgi:cytochrome c oxidase subunit 2